MNGLLLILFRFLHTLMYHCGHAFYFLIPYDLNIPNIVSWEVAVKEMEYVQLTICLALHGKQPIYFPV